jgi:tetratricopeptide (TPR) repeat protein
MLMAFAPFTSFLNAMKLEKYLVALQGEGLFKEATLADLEEALAQAEKQGLVKEEAFKKCYALQPVFPFFLWQQVMTEGAGKDPEGAGALEKAFCGYMSILAQSYDEPMESKESGERQGGQYLFQQDRENLHKALNRVLAGQGDFYELYNVFSTYYHESPNYKEAIAWMEEVAGKLEKYANANRDSEFLVNYAAVVGNLGSQYAKIKDYYQAKEKLGKAQELYEKAGRRQEMAVGYHQLGRVAEEERDFAEAKRCYREEMKICQEFNDRYGQARTYHQLGMVAQEERDFAEAKRCYREALKLKQEFNDRYGQASTYHQLGMVAKRERDFAEALRDYSLALEIWLQYNDEYHAKIAINNLGLLFQDWEPPAGAIAGLENSDQVKEILNAVLEESGKKR